MKSRKNIFMYMTLFLCLSTVACTGPLFRNYGSITLSSETKRALETYQVNPDIRYYISGSEIHPRALIGLYRDYILSPKTLWKEVEMTPKMMKDIVGSTQPYGQHAAQGFDLLDDKGRHIGFWYSIPSARTFIRVQEDGTIRIDTPNLDTSKVGLMRNKK